MITIYNIVILTVYSAAAVLSLRYPRALAWVCVGAFTYVWTVVYWRLGLPWPAIMSGAVDFTVCLALFLLARYRWEMWLWILFQLALLLNFVHSLGLSGSLEHTIALEVVNVLAAVTAGGVAAFHTAGHTDAGAFHPWVSVLGRVRPLYREADED